MFINTVCYPTLLANFTQELSKLIKIAQNNSSRIKNIIDKQEKFEDKFDIKINEQNNQISEILMLLKDREPEIEQKNKGRNKPKKADEFYQVNINLILLFLYIIYIRL